MCICGVFVSSLIFIFFSFNSFATLRFFSFSTVFCWLRWLLCLFVYILYDMIMFIHKNSFGWNSSVVSRFELSCVVLYIYKWFFCTSANFLAHKILRCVPLCHSFSRFICVSVYRLFYAIDMCALRNIQ